GPWYWSCVGSNGGSTANCSANKTASPVNGQCGSSNGGSFSSAPTSGLCDSGTPSSVAGSGPWTWKCTGTSGGIIAYCSASKTITVDGKCGAANEGSYTTVPIVGLCSQGTATTPIFNGTNRWAWNCTGINNGTTETCYANKITLINGECGSSNGGSFSSAPTSGLCDSGTPSSVAGSGPWTWKCNGISGGTTAYCNATKVAIVNGKCGCSHGQTFNVAPISCLCTTGTPTLVTASANNTWIWTCKGDTAGTDECCTAYKRVVNAKPIVDAGDNLEVAPGASVTIEAVASDADGDTLTYSWRCNSGALSSWSVLQPAWTAPLTTQATSYTCTITVSDGKDTATDTMSIRIRIDKVNGVCGSSNGQTLNAKPTIDLCESGSNTIVSGTGPWLWTCKGLNGGTSSNCSADKNNHVPVVTLSNTRELNEGQTILLKAEATDADNDALTYSWACSGGRLSSTTVLMPYYTAPSTASDRTHSCTLTVKDNSNGISSGSVSILIRTYSSNKNNAPVVNAGESREIKSAQSITLSGATATDADGDSLNYLWSCTGGILSGKNLLDPTFTAPTVNSNQSYTCTLTVNDGKGGYSSDSLSIIVKSQVVTKNNVPVVAVIQDREVNQGQSIILYAIVYDPDGDNLTYSWSCSGGSLSDNTSLMPIYTSYAYNTSNSTYNCSISVSDGRGGSSTKNVRITVRGTGVVPTSKPTVDAGTNKELNQGQSIVFNATASDSAGDELSYNWTCNNGTLSNSSILNPTYTAAYSSGSSTCTLTARNSKGVAASDSLIVTVRQDIVY
ncbi:MAG: PKD domain-containing protein, partial [Candidatus Paceibacterota bacterium]